MAEIEKIYRRKLDNLKKAVRQLPTVYGTEAVSHFKESFKGRGYQAFNDYNAPAWPSRKSKKDNQGRALLVKTGNLRDSIEVIRQTSKEVEVGSNEEYASIHNYGLEGLAWGKHRFTMPKRKFIGTSKKLEEKLANMTAKIVKSFI